MADIFLAINQHLMVVIRRADTNGQLLRYLLETYGYEGEIHVHSGLTRLPHTGAHTTATSGQMPVHPPTQHHRDIYRQPIGASI